MITAATRPFALLGNPVQHSLSPAMQNAAFGAAGADGIYIALRCDPDGFPGLLRGFARAGGGGNVTIPHKALAARTVDEPSGDVLRTGACNTFWEEEGRLRGDNTDVAGFRAAAVTLLGSLAGARVLVLGAGGAASAALCGLLDARADTVAVLSRTPERAVELCHRLDPAGRRLQAATGLRLAREGFDLVVNATPLGLHAGDPLPLDLTTVGRAGAALDLVYGADETPWVRHARELEVAAADGREMLLGQGAASFERWWDRPAPRDAMRAALFGS